MNELCPVCRQGNVICVAIVPQQRRKVWICEECDALWDSEATVGNDLQVIAYPVYMERRGLKGVWSNLEIIPCESGEGKP